MDAIQAAVLDVKLRYLDRWNNMRREIAAFYLDRLADIPVRLPAVLSGADHVYHLYVVRHSRRKHIIEGFDQVGIATGLHYPIPLHRQEVLRKTGFRAESLAVTQETADQCFSLPLYPGMPPGYQRKVTETLERIVADVG
jgi:dTDP-4-amino-4,6-dideoxygalactose transaminase